MKILLLFGLIKILLFRDFVLDRYGTSDIVLNGNGFIFLDISGFSPGDSIYLTFNAVDGEYFNYIEYTFSNSFSSVYIKADQITYAYSEDYRINEHKFSSDTLILFDHYYYFEFTKPKYDKKYLVMRLILPNQRDFLLRVENTKYRRYVVTIIIINVIAGILFIITFIIFIIKYPRCRKLWKKQNMNDDNFNSPKENNNNLNEEINYPSSTITNYGDNLVENKQNQDNKIYDNAFPINS